MQTELLEAHPTAAIQALVVWVPALTTDTVAAARSAAPLFHDIRVSHFYDGRRQIAAAIAASVGGTGNIAWDCYLFYRAGARWEETAPPPERWVHQLGPGTWADPGRFRWADDLAKELRAAAAQLLKGGERTKRA